MKNMFLILLFLTLIGTSCSEDTLDSIDTNQNVVTNPTLGSLLPSAEMRVFQQVVANISRVAGYTAENTNFSGLNTATNQQLVGGPGWSDAYKAIRYFNDIRTRAETEQRIGYAAIADIMNAYTFSLLVDAYGDIPYSEAGQEAITQPKFDNARDVHASIQGLLDQGISKCESAIAAGRNSSPGVDDLVFKGDMNLWKKTAWGLKARLLNRLSNVDPKNTDILTALANSFSATENFTISVYQSNQENGNPLANNYLSASTIVIASGIVTAMKRFLDPSEEVLADPRASIWFTKIGGAVVTPPTSRGETDITLNGTRYSKPLYLQNRTSPLPILTYAELKFMEAEVQLRTGDATKAYNAYLAAVRAALGQAALFNSAVALTQAQIDQYLARPLVSMGATNLTLTDILNQKYIYLTVFQSQEAFNDVRRVTAVTLVDPDGTPKRLPYPVDEIARNVNAPQVSDQNTVYNENARLFWAKR